MRSPNFEVHLRDHSKSVINNVERFGRPEVVEFRQGWFNDCLPSHSENIAHIRADVDFQSSLHDVVVNLWPHLNPEGYFFTDEYMLLDYCGLF